MKHTKHVKTITYSAIAVAVSIVLLAIARFAQVVDLTVLLLVAVTICIPFCEKLYTAGVLSQQLHHSLQASTFCHLCLYFGLDRVR